jgi:acyl-CoA synthetase (AMP-forming)/AMP-acid ligase II
VVSVDAHPFPALPASVTERTVSDMLRGAVLEAPDRVAVIAHSLITGGELSITYRELDERSRRFATILRERGVGPGDRVAIMIGNDGAAEAHIAYHGAHHVGAIAVPVNTFYVGREFGYAMGFIKPAAIVFAPQFGDMVKTVDRGDTPTVLEAGPEPHIGESLRELLDRAEPDASDHDAHELDDADWLFTSGTTGHPKAVALTHANSVACGQEARWVWGLDGESVYQNSSPFFTSTGCHTNLLACLATRCTFVIDPEVDAQAIFERAVRHGTTSMFALTAILAILFRRLDQGRLRSLDIPTLRRLAYGGQTMPRPFHDRIEHEFTEQRGVGLVICYGLTEGGTSGIMLEPDDHAEAVRRHGSYGLSIGRRPWNDWIECRVAAQDGSEVPTGEVGEIWLRAPSVMSRYVGNEEATLAALEGGWLHTGDMAIRDDEGFVYFVDRAKSMIRRGGMNIAAAEVEACLLNHPAITEAAVIGRANPVLGEDIHAVIVVEPGQELPAEDVIEFCRGQLAEYKIPRSVSFAEALPRNAMGKVARGELAALVPE